MDKYYVVGLKNDQVANGELSRIADVIRNAFFETAKAVIEHRLVGVKEDWAVIRFEGSFLLNQDSVNPYPDYGEIIYLNQLAWDEFKNKGIALVAIEEIIGLPDRELCTFISMPIYG